MPLVSVGRFKASPVVFNSDGTQYLKELRFNGPTTINLDVSTFEKSGNYILFKYTSFPASTANGSQWDLDSYVAPNIQLINDPTKLSGVDYVLDDPAYKRVVVRLGSNKENGAQYVEGNLLFTGPPRIILSPKLYATPGAYKLFIVNGTVTGESYINGNVQISGSVLKQTAPVYTTVDGVSGVTTVWLPIG